MGDVCEKIHAGGDAPKDNFSFEKTDKFAVPIYANGVAENGLYGYTNITKFNQQCVTVSARGTIGYAVARNEGFYPIVRLLVLIPKDVIDYRYLSYVINDIKFEKCGSSIPQLTIPQISNYNIPIPSLEIQQQIVDEISAKNEYIKLTKQIISKQKAKMKDIIGSLLH